MAEAEKLYQSGEWEKARQAYEHVLASGEQLPPAFYYNFGTVSLRASKAGAGYVYLLKALSQSPFDGDVAYNLRMARNALPASARATHPSSWISAWPLSWHFFPVEFFFLPFLAALGFTLWTAAEKGKSKFIPATALSFILLVVAGIGFYQTHSTVAGVISAAKIKSGPGASFPDITLLEPGSVVDTEEAREGWTKIRFSGSDGAELVGWAEPGALLPIR